MAETRRKQGIKREFSAGGVVFRNGEWLIIRPAGTERWQLPKGNIEQGESSSETALREVEEEGGVKVKLIRRIDKIQYFFTFQGQKILKTVTYFLMEYVGETKKGPDHEVEKRLFLPFKKAYTKLTFENDKQILKKADSLLREIGKN